MGGVVCVERSERGGIATLTCVCAVWNGPPSCVNFVLDNPHAGHPDQSSVACHCQYVATPTWQKNFENSNLLGVSTAKSGMTSHACQLSHVSYWRGGGGGRGGNSELVVPRATPSRCCLVRVASAQTCAHAWVGHAMPRRAHSLALLPNQPLLARPSVGPEVGRKYDRKRSMLCKHLVQTLAHTCAI